MSNLLPTSYYDGRAQTVDLTDITSSDNNVDILRRLRNNDPELTSLCIYEDDFENSEFDYFVVQEGNDLGWLGYFLGRNTMLTELCIHDMPGDRDRITALVRGIEQNRSIARLSIVRDPLGDSVLSFLSSILRSKSCSLTTLCLKLGNTRVSDEVAVALADALKDNKSLKQLCFDSRDLTSVGWSAFSKLLCDTSSVNNTYLSNHTLRVLGWSDHDDVKQLLALNKQANKQVATRKILKYHPDLDVGPFLAKSKLKLLPLVMSWFERGRVISEESEKAFDTRQLSTMYKFVRGVPLEASDGYRSYSIHKKRKFNLLDHNLILMCTPVLLCLLDLLFPTWSDFVAPSMALCVCLLQIASYRLCLVVVIGGVIGGAIGAIVV